MGTVQYMSPEQARGRNVDARSDIWSLGIVLYELLAGRVPFAGETASHVMVSLMEDELPPLTGFENVPPELDRIVTRTLRKQPNDRYQKASQLALELKHLKDELRMELRLTHILKAVPGRDTVTSASFIESVAKKRSVFLPMVLLVVLIAAAAGGYRLIKLRGAIAHNEPARPLINAGLIAIPGGTFEVGRFGGQLTESPPYKVEVQAFEMDKTEVTNGEYGQFVMQTSHAPPEHWGAVTPPLGREMYPVSNVSYEDVLAFAKWRSERDGVAYRLPTEEEWEYAARNGDLDNYYPWGNSWESKRAVTIETGFGEAQPVGSFPLGANRWGVLDLLGNVWEWTQSKASMYKIDGEPNRLPARFKDWIVVRGGGYGSQSIRISGTTRDWFAPDFKSPVLGFRLIKSSAP